MAADRVLAGDAKPGLYYGKNRAVIEIVTLSVARKTAAWGPPPPGRPIPYRRKPLPRARRMKLKRCEAGKTIRGWLAEDYPLRPVSDG